MVAPDRPQQAILNFAHRCALHCEWCYVPFGPVPARRETTLSVVERVAALGFTSITVGGGDPFQYSFIGDVLRAAKSHGLFVHVDTHGKSLRESAANLELIDSTVDLLGLPLDGPTAVVHDTMRNASGHFELVCRRLRWLAGHIGRVKLNTVVSAMNVDELSRLAELVVMSSPGRWSIYQYWPLGPGARANAMHGIDDALFVNATTNLRGAWAGKATHAEVNAREVRRDTYPIVHHDGEVFIHAAAPDHHFVSLGSIFDEDILHILLRYCGPEREMAAARYGGGLRGKGHTPGH